MKTHKLYIISVAILSLLLLSAVILFLSYDYDVLITKAITISGKSYLENVLRNRVFSQSKFQILRNVCFLLLGVIPVYTFSFIRYRSTISYIIKKIFQTIRQGIVSIVTVYRHNSRKENISIAILILIVIVRSAYYLISFDLQYDEMWSYNYFTAQPLYCSLIVSSNYPLYEASTQLFKWLPFDMKINLRLPVVITGIISCLVLYACLRKWFQNHIAAWSGTVVYAFMPVTTFYMLYARGVIFAQQFSIIAVFSVLFWLRHGQQKRYLILYATAIVLGLYAMPTYLYLWLLLFLILLVSCLLKYRRQLTDIMAANAGAGGLGIFLYLPFIAGSGLSFLPDPSSAGNEMPEPGGWQYFMGVSNFFTGFGWGFICLLLLSLLALFISWQAQKRAVLPVLCFVLCISPITIYLLQDIRIPPRALAFAGLSLPLLFSQFISLVEKKQKPVFIIACMVIVGTCTAWISNRHEYLNWSRTDDKETRELSELFLQHHITTCYDSSSQSYFFYYYPALEYYYSTAHETFDLATARKNSLRHKSFSVTDNYDCIVSAATDTLAINYYHQWIKNKKEGFTVYLRDGK